MSQQEVKEGILSRIRQGKPKLHPLPDLPKFPYRGDPVEDFSQHVINFDGRVVEFKTREDAVTWLMAQPEMQAGRVIFSSATGVSGNVAEDALKDLHDAARVETCVTEGLLGVGEMGAIWVTNESLKHAVCALLSRRMFVLLNGDLIVGGLHDAYERLDLKKTQYGSFYAGPSATADIEAVHITGAQGPLAMTALIYNRPDAPMPPVLRVNPHADKSVWQENM